MFGFFRPDCIYLSSKDRKFYRRNMCILCTALANSYGLKGRLLICYEALFLQVLLTELASLKEESQPLLYYRLRLLRCLIKPHNRDFRTSLASSCVAIPLALSMYLGYLKMADDAVDSPKWYNKIGEKLMRKPAEKAREELIKRGVIGDKLKKFLKKQGDVEQQKGLPLFEYIHPTAEAFAHVYEIGSKDAAERQNLNSVGRSIGTILVLVDAIADYEEDHKNSVYNLLAWYKNLNAAKLPEEIRKEAAEIIERTFAEGLHSLYELKARQTARVFIAIKDKIDSIAKLEHFQIEQRHPNKKLHRFALVTTALGALGALSDDTWLIAAVLFLALFLVMIIFMYVHDSRKAMLKQAIKQGLMWHKGKTGFFITNFSSLVGRWKDAQDALSSYIFHKLRPETQTYIEKYDGNPALLQELVVLLDEDLNEMTKATFLYSPERFSNVKIDEQTLQLVQEHPQGREIQWLNWSLLATAYPKEIAKRKLNLHSSGNECCDCECCYYSFEGCTQCAGNGCCQCASEECCKGGCDAAGAGCCDACCSGCSGC